MSVTVNQLIEDLMASVSARDRDYVKVHVVFHGHNTPSFNLPVKQVRRGANNDDYLIICEEERK
jgi:hypothetical protein